MNRPFDLDGTIEKMGNPGRWQPLLLIIMSEERRIKSIIKKLKKKLPEYIDWKAVEKDLIPIEKGQHLKPKKRKR